MFFLFFFLSTIQAGLYLHSNGTQELIPIENANVILPNVTEIRIEDVLVNLAAELTELRSLVSTVGCVWQGVSCHCHYHENTLGTDTIVLVGSYCDGGSLQWVKVLDVQNADFLVGCAVANDTLCDVYFE